MADNFYGQWFKRTQPRQLTPEERWQKETEQLISLAQSERAEAIKERFDVPEVDEAESIFKAALQEITDPEIRNKIDMAAGKISRAYEILGFCMGHFSQDSRSFNF